MRFEEEWDKIKLNEHFDSFSFRGASADWRKTVLKHFNNSTLNCKCYGVYIVRQKSTGKVIYVGKSGTMCQDGSYKDQDIQKRLVNREKGKSRKEIFGKRVSDYGELLIEYIVLKTRSLIPGYLEACLLQAYYDEYKKLPLENSSF